MPVSWLEATGNEALNDATISSKSYVDYILQYFLIISQKLVVQRSISSAVGFLLGNIIAQKAFTKVLRYHCRTVAMLYYDSDLNFILC